MEPDLISIVIPTFNRLELVQETIQSALNQTYENIEIIVLDNNSFDGTYEFLTELYEDVKKVFVYRNSVTLNIVENWIQCLSYAKGDYCHILWSDDKIDPNFIAVTYGILSQEEEVGFVYTRTAFFSDNNIVKRGVYDIGNSGIYDRSVFIEKSLLDAPRAVPVSPANALFRTSDLRSCLVLNIKNNYKKDFSKIGQGNDNLIFLLTLEKYKNFGYVNEDLAYFRVHEDSLTLSTNSLEVTVNYHIAKAYYISECNPSHSVLIKFNSKIVAISILSLIYKGKRQIRLKNLYTNLVSTEFTFLYVLSAFWKYVKYKLND